MSSTEVTTELWPIAVPLRVRWAVLSEQAGVTLLTGLTVVTRLDQDDCIRKIEFVAELTLAAVQGPHFGRQNKVTSWPEVVLGVLEIRKVLLTKLNQRVEEDDAVCSPLPVPVHASSARTKVVEFLHVEPPDVLELLLNLVSQLIWPFTDLPGLEHP